MLLMITWLILFQTYLFVASNALENGVVIGLD